MANVLMEGFTHLNTSALLGVKGWATAGTLSFATATPRFAGGQYLTLGNTATITKVVPAHATYTVGFALYLTSATDTSSLVGLLDSGTLQTDLRINAAGQLFVTRNGTTIGGPSTNAFASATWYYVEFQCTINDTTGSFTAKVNGTTWLTGSSLDTKNTTNASANQIRLYGSSTGHLMCDVYGNDGSGAADNSFWDDIRVVTLYPSGAGTTTQWTASTGSNYTCVDEAPPNTTDYVSTATANNVDLYTMDDLASSVGAIKAVQVVLYGSKDDAGTRTVAAALRSGGTTYVGSTQSLLDTWSFLTQIWTTDPATSAAWTESAVNAVEAGMKLIS